MSKTYFRDGSTFEKLVLGLGSCIASDRITVDGVLVGFMYREAPDNDFDSGWKFFAGDENDDYANKPGNFGLFDVNTIANYDAAIIDYLSSPIGTAFVREGNIFALDRTFLLSGPDVN